MAATGASNALVGAALTSLANIQDPTAKPSEQLLQLTLARLGAESARLASRALKLSRDARYPDWLSAWTLVRQGELNEAAGRPQAALGFYPRALDRPDLGAGFYWAAQAGVLRLGGR